MGLLAIVSVAQAQMTTPYGTLFYKFGFLRNPAQVVNYQHAVYVGYQNYWVDVSGAPQNLFVGGIYRFRPEVAISMSLDKYMESFVTRTSGRLQGAYKFKIDKKQSLKFGLEAKIVDTRLDMDKIVVFDHEPLLRELDRTAPYVYFSAGAEYVYDRFSAEVFIPQGTEHSFDVTEGVYALANYSVPLKKGFEVKGGAGGGILYESGYWEVDAQVSYQSAFDLNLRYHSLGIVSMGFAINFGQLTGSASYSANVKSDSGMGGNHEAFLMYGGEVSDIRKRRFNKNKKLSGKSIDIGDELQRLEEQNEELAKSLDKVLEELEELNKKQQDFIDSEKGESKMKSYPLEHMESAEESDEKDEVKAGYYVVVASSKHMADFEKLKASLAKVGMKAGVFFNNRKERYYLYTAKFDTMKEAMKEMKRMRKSRFKGVRVHRYKPE
ncbi:hypothetical protein FUAX_44530 (plasmid) [Fulvitalea axinellae]|uniref:SPOR domain-containing protein n=2 Tax=Fulvitalea axinellae TaxID=1182444 RepID=A0AAU9CIS9_9BACT|nr:hypothetical protein FUAX_44530 [Fulvitalea axinellae]